MAISAAINRFVRNTQKIAGSRAWGYTESLLHLSALSSQSQALHKSDETNIIMEETVEFEQSDDELLKEAIELEQLKKDCINMKRELDVTIKE